MRPTCRLIGDERGATLMEFGLLVVPMCVLLMGMLDMGYLMYLRSNFQGAINDVARMATVQSPNLTGTGTIDQRIDAAIQEKMQGLAVNATYSIGKQSVDQFSRIGKGETLITDANGNGAVDPGDCWVDLQENGTWDASPVRTGIGGADDVVLYTATLTMPRMFPVAALIGLSSNYNISVRATVRNQPYANQSVPPNACSPRS